MPRDPKDTRSGHYLQLSQIGLEMVIPIVIGLYLDDYWKTSPWLISAGAVLGFAVGMLHLVVVVNKAPPDDEDVDSKP